MQIWFKKPARTLRNAAIWHIQRLPLVAHCVVILRSHLCSKRLPGSPFNPGTQRHVREEMKPRGGKFQSTRPAFPLEPKALDLTLERRCCMLNNTDSFLWQPRSPCLRRNYIGTIPGGNALLSNLGRQRTFC